MSTVDGTLDDGWGFPFPVKGREIEATVLFADISGFSTRTLDMSPAATLVYVQNFFAWITAEALHGRPGIVDKYIGDEVMVVFSNEFGSEEPFLDAVRAAAAMSSDRVRLSGCRIKDASPPYLAFGANAIFGGVASESPGRWGAPSSPATSPLEHLPRGTCLPELNALRARRPGGPGRAGWRAGGPASSRRPHVNLRGPACDRLRGAAACPRKPDRDDQGPGWPVGQRSRKPGVWAGRGCSLAPGQAGVAGPCPAVGSWRRAGPGPGSVSEGERDGQG